VKTGISFRKDILDDLENYMKSLGIKSRSKIVNEAVGMYLADRAVLMGKGIVGGAVLIYYDHEVREIRENLTHVQHDFMDVIISNTHAHIDKRHCIEAILVKGRIERIKELIKALESLHGLKELRLGLFKIGEE